MRSPYWIKLYQEVLNDPKMGRLPDRLWRRVIECFLLAGEQRDGGYLPSLEDMAWTLRCDAEQLEGELSQIAEKTGIVEKRDGRWFVVHFEARQSVATEIIEWELGKATQRQEHAGVDGRPIEIIEIASS